ncbi:acyl-CoA dehydrogenase family protein [Pseudonocardia hispaniensis]|uniref:Acyl-CoA dehydrogenase family protein n=1 Tax=Pseudonocardia hispaniensis TaxID=904933 RepID=A0ABW1J0N8_9PSEU
MTVDGARLDQSEYDELRQVLRAFFDECQPSEPPTEHTPALDRAQWLRMAGELGVQGLLIPEQWGGAGATLAEVGLVFEEAGRALHPFPLLSTIGLATPALLASGNEVAMKRYLPSIADGSCVATLAFVEPVGRWDPTSYDTTAVAEADGWQVNGVKDYVLDGTEADLMLVVADSAEGRVLLAVDPRQPGVQVIDRPALDRSRSLARVELDAVPAVLVAAPEEAPRSQQHAVDTALVCLAAEQVGGGERCLEMSVGHARERIQFGRPIGSFQAIKHKCADMLVELESGRALQRAALEQVLHHSPDRHIATAMAKSFCSEMFHHLAAENIQIHGAMGFSWEFEAHRYYKRATAAAVLFGSPLDHRLRLAELLDY